MGMLNTTEMNHWCNLKQQNVKKWNEKCKNNFRKQRQTGICGHRSENLRKMKRQTQVFDKTELVVKWDTSEICKEEVKLLNPAEFVYSSSRPPAVTPPPWPIKTLPRWSWVDNDQNQEAGSPRWCHFLHFLFDLMVTDRSSGSASAGILLLAQHSCRSLILHFVISCYLFLAPK